MVVQLNMIYNKVTKVAHIYDFVMDTCANMELLKQEGVRCAYDKYELIRDAMYDEDRINLLFVNKDDKLCAVTTTYNEEGKEKLRQELTKFALSGGNYKGNAGGYLPIDRSTGPFPTPQDKENAMRVNKIAHYRWTEVECGNVVLYQRRLGPLSYEYYAKTTKHPRRAQ